MKALTLTNQKVCPMLKFLLTKKETNGRAKNYMPPIYRCKGIKTTQSKLLDTLKETALENTVGKGENAGNQHFLLFPQCFLLYQREQLSF